MMVNAKTPSPPGEMQEMGPGAASCFLGSYLGVLGGLAFTSSLC